MSYLSPTLVWFRDDLRVTDNPALREAVRRGRPVVPIFVLDDETPGETKLGAASRWWLHQSLAALAADLRRLGSPLILRRGPAERVVREIVDETGSDAIFANRVIARSEPARIQGIETRVLDDDLLFEPKDVRTANGDAFRVFTPFWNACRKLAPPARPLPAPLALTPPARAVPSNILDAWALRPTRPNWAREFADHWTPGEAGAATRVERFIAATMKGYATRRDRPDIEGTSGLSPHLRWGEIGPRQVWHAVAGQGDDRDADRFLTELGWREFSRHMLLADPALPRRSMRRAFERFPWREDGDALLAWRMGRTGVPIVDAAMRQLERTGWMHNRMRMVVASFLVKDLLIDWRHGAAWFWDTLVDADLANNSASWQWVAGCGADAAPYFRVFNPVRQAERFDPEGDYVRRFVPELAGLPKTWIHQPHRAPDDLLRRAGVRLGENYPSPIVEHDQARRRALGAFATIRREAS